MMAFLRIHIPRNLALLLSVLAISTAPACALKGTLSSELDEAATHRLLSSSNSGSSGGEGIGNKKGIGNNKGVRNNQGVRKNKGNGNDKGVGNDKGGGGGGGGCALEGSSCNKKNPCCEGAGICTGKGKNAKCVSPETVPAPTSAPVKPPTAAPVKAPTAAPVKPPTAAPVKPPTAAPVKPPTVAPVKPPTSAPVKPPTAAPVKPPTAAPIRPPTAAPVKPPTSAPVKPPTSASVPEPTAPAPTAPAPTAPAPTAPAPTAPNPVDTLCLDYKAADHIRYNPCVDLSVSGADAEKLTNAFVKGKAKWESLVTGNLHYDYSTEGMNENYSCTGGYPRTLDDLYLCGKIGELPEGTIATAGTVYVRGAGDPMHDVGLSGYLTFSPLYLGQYNEAQLERIILHEIAHVMGIQGRAWEMRGLRTGTAPNFKYVGTKGCEKYAEITGCANKCPPVEEGGSSGTQGSHWDDEDMVNELMTGYFNDDMPNPISVVTLGSLEDLGYSVNYTKADPYTYPHSGAGCRRRQLRPAEGSKGLINGKPPISPKGIEKAKEVGKKALAKARAAAPKKRVNPSTGAVYVADLSVDVIVKEGDNIYAVDVAADCNAEDVACND